MDYEIMEYGSSCVAMPLDVNFSCCLTGVRPPVMT